MDADFPKRLIKALEEQMDGEGHLACHVLGCAIDAVAKASAPPFAPDSEAVAQPVDPVTAAMRDPRWVRHWVPMVRPDGTFVVVSTSEIQHDFLGIIAAGPDAPSACQAAIAGVGGGEKEND